MSINQITQNINNQTTSFQQWLDGQLSAWVIQPTQAEGIGGFVFSIKEDDRVELNAEITDYVMEDGSVIQDHIVIKPKLLTLRGLIGEISLTTSTPTGRLMQQIEARLTPLASYLPPLDAKAQSILDSTINSVNTLVSDIDNAISFTNNLVNAVKTTSPGDTVQQQAYAKLEAMMSEKQLITVVSPWGYFTQMALLSVIFEQDKTTQLYTDASVVLKQITTAETESTGQLAWGRTLNLLSPTIQKSNLTGIDQAAVATPCWSGLNDQIMNAQLSYIQSPTAARLAAATLNYN